MIYDCFTFFNELDLLELRLNLLNGCVDKFVIAEANKTHTGTDKEFIFEKNKERFAKFLDKIIYIKVDDFPPLENSENDKFGNKWLYENFQRDAVMRGLKEAKPDDIIMISDLDEIPNPKAIKKYKKGIYTFKQYSFYYALNTLNVYSPYIKRGIICRYKNLIDPKRNPREKQYCKFSSYGKPTYLRFCRNKRLNNGGWHFSYLGDLETILLKRNSIVEQQLNNTENMTLESMQEAIASGKDILGRDTVFMNINPKDILPDYVIKNLDRYEKFINQKNLKSLLNWKIKYCFSKICTVKSEDGSADGPKILKLFGFKIKLKTRT